jgi:hypothetical protein
VPAAARPVCEIGIIDNQVGLISYRVAGTKKKANVFFQVADTIVGLYFQVQFDDRHGYRFFLICKASAGALLETERRTAFQCAARQGKPVPGTGNTVPVMDL